MANQLSKKLGLEAERELMTNLQMAGFWVHKLKENENGAPFDLIACKNDTVYAFEVKNIAKGTKFSLERIEDNQRKAYEKWKETGNSNFLFAFRVPSGWRFWDAWTISTFSEAPLSRMDVDNVLLSCTSIEELERRTG